MFAIKLLIALWDISMIDASGGNGDAAERGQCTHTDKSLHLQVDHCIKDVFKETLLIAVDLNLQWKLFKYTEKHKHRYTL